MFIVLVHQSLLLSRTTNIVYLNSDKGTTPNKTENLKEVNEEREKCTAKVGRVMTMLSSQSTEQEKKQFNVNAKVNIEVCKNEQRLRLKHTYTHTTRKFIKRNDVTDFAFLYFTCAVVRRVSFRLAWFFFRICTFCVELNEKNEALYSCFHLRRKSFQSVAGKDQRRQKKINRAITT